MVKSYCVKQKKQTECVEPSGYKTAKNGRLKFWCTCAECEIKKVQVCKKRKLIGPSQAGGDLFDTAVGTATDLFVHHGLPWMGKKQLRWEDITGQNHNAIKSYRKKLSTTLWIN